MGYESTFVCQRFGYESISYCEVIVLVVREVIVCNVRNFRKAANEKWKIVRHVEGGEGGEGWMESSRQSTLKYTKV